MDTKNFNNTAEIFFTDTITADEATTKQQKENTTLKKIINSENSSKSYSLKMSPTLYKKARIKAESEGRSFNNYVNQLILRDLIK